MCQQIQDGVVPAELMSNLVYGGLEGFEKAVAVA
jgi:hypothetical protein